MKHLFAIILTSALLLCGCKSASPWASPENWVISQNDNNTLDVIYLVSVNVSQSFDADSNEVYLAVLTDEERATIKEEMEYVQQAFGDSVNYYSPFYHQFTFSAINLPPQDFARYRQASFEDVLAAFNYYMDNYNQGRDFVLIGFSQGAMHVVDLLKAMSDEQYAHCVAAYSLGYRVSADDLQHSHIKAATGETDRGVIVSFNSVTDTAALWPLVSSDAACCINPVNWRTDTTEAHFNIDTNNVSIRIDPDHNVLLLSGLNAEQYFLPASKSHCKVGNLHIGDLLFYLDRIAANAQKRHKNSSK